LSSLRESAKKNICGINLIPHMVEFSTSDILNLNATPIENVVGVIEDVKNE
jgi:hypothetical protein